MQQEASKITQVKFINTLFDLSLLIYFCAYFAFFQDTGYNGAPIRLFSTVLLIIVGSLMCIQRLRQISTLTIWYFLFISLAFFSVIWAKDDSLVISVLPSLFRVLLVTSLLYVRVQDNNDIEKILDLYLISIIVLNIAILNLMINYYGINGFLLKRFGDNFNYNSNTTAIVNVIAVMVCIHKQKKCNRIIPKLLIMFMSLFYIFIVILTESKKGILGLILGIFLFAYYKVRGIKKFRNIIIGIILMIFAAILIMNVPALYDVIGYRFESMNKVLFGADANDMSTEFRMELISQGLKIFGSHPILGVGLNNFTEFQTVRIEGYYAHNNYVELLADLGIVGFLGYYYMLVKLAMYKIDSKNGIQVLLKSIIMLVFFFDIGAVTYQDLRIQLFIALAYIAFFLITNNLSESK